ncbi:unannotated protein [freshwater metagenome]|uniref:Unannotated protein n=1 Tax=freshwater metagenome TaxID=449393 RepID=A0A6J7XPD1_9ZZZZ
MSGLSATMYAIVKNVTTPPRTSRPTVEPRSEILKYESSMTYPFLLWFKGFVEPFAPYAGAQPEGRYSIRYLLLRGNTSNHTKGHCY